jgi:tRNA (guanine-N7-)-methyltransferase
LVAERIERALRKRDRAKLSNLHFIQADARTFLETLPLGTNSDAIFVLFPDPWPKSRHRKHRILQPDFLVSLAARALPTARLYFRTDFHPYFADVSAALGQGSGWERVAEPWPFEFETVFQSRAKAFHSLVARPMTVARISSRPS